MMIAWAAMQKLAVVILIVILAVVFGPGAGVGFVLQQAGKRMLLASIWGLDQVVLMKRFVFGENV
jgi:hypothetical protein